ncbi:MAG: diguanylate cyclase [Halanaerobiales bacterium]|nr:diguanylate cyclase [Halanaerobiales bacterium]
MEKLKRIFKNDVINNDIRYRTFDFSFCFKLFILFVLAGVFFDNPANSINFSVFPLEEAVRVNLRPPIIMLGGMILGPIWGLVIGGTVDIISFRLWHFDLNYLFIFTLITMLRGFLAGYIYNYLFKKFSMEAILASIGVTHVLVSSFFIPVVLYYTYGVPLINNIQVRLFIQILAIPVYSLAFFYILKGMNKSKELKKLHKELQVMLKFDDLTGLANRRSFMDYFKQKLSQAKDNSDKLSLLMLDIDNFKDINDTFGHQRGDHVLKEVSIILTENVRRKDLAARLGGDEFLVLLPNTDKDNAEKIAKRIKDDISSLDIFNKDYYTTVSIGGAALNRNDDIESLLKRADDALYKAKDRGRNRVEWMNKDNLSQTLKFS